MDSKGWHKHKDGEWHKVESRHYLDAANYLKAAQLGVPFSVGKKTVLRKE